MLVVSQTKTRNDNDFCRLRHYKIAATISIYCGVIRRFQVWKDFSINKRITDVTLIYNWKFRYFVFYRYGQVHHILLITIKTKGSNGCRIINTFIKKTWYIEI